MDAICFSSFPPSGGGVASACPEWSRGATARIASAPTRMSARAAQMNLVFIFECDSRLRRMGCAHALEGFALCLDHAGRDQFLSAPLENHARQRTRWWPGDHRSIRGGIFTLVARARESVGLGMVEDGAR